MKNIKIIIHSRHVYDMQWHTLLSKQAENNTLVLIATPKSIKKLTGLNQNVFAAVYETQHFDFEHLEEIFRTIHQDIYCEGDTTKVSTVAEYDMMVTAQLRDHFRETLSIEGPGLNVIPPFRDKLQMKAVLVNSQIRIPRFVPFDRQLFLMEPALYMDQLEDYLQFPMFAKPIDGVSSLNTALIRNKEQLHEWLGGIYNADLLASVVFWHRNYSVLVNEFNGLDSQHLVSMKKQPAATPTFLLVCNPLNRLKPLGCTSTSYDLSFFKKSNLAIGAVAMTSLLDGQATTHGDFQSQNTAEIDLLFVSLTLGAGMMVVLLLYVLWRILPREVEDVEAIAINLRSNALIV